MLTITLQLADIKPKTELGAGRVGGRGGGRRTHCVICAVQHLMAPQKLNQTTLEYSSTRGWQNFSPNTELSLTESVVRVQMQLFSHEEAGSPKF